VELLKSKEAALEKNVEQLYCAAKRRVARQEEELQELRTHPHPHPHPHPNPRVARQEEELQELRTH